jgi:hypothetical protein
MTIEDVLIEQIGLAIPELSGRVYPAFALDPNTPAPYVAYVSSEGLVVRTLSGPTSSRQLDIELNVIVIGYAAMRGLSKAVTDVLESLSGTTSGTILIEEITYERQSDEIFEEDGNVFRSVISGTIHYKEE